MRSRISIVLIALATFGAALVGSCGSASATAKHTAILYGDSLAWETTVNTPSCLAGKACHTKTVQQFMAAYPGWNLVVRAIPGRAPCDFLPNRAVTQPVYPDMAADMATYHPDVVMLEAEGNSQTNCMIDPSTGTYFVPGSDGYFNQYRSDFYTFLGIATSGGAKVVVVPPIATFNSSYNDSQVATLNQIAVQEAGKFPHTTTTSAPDLAVTNNGAFTQSMACLSTEGAAKGCVSGQIQVREPAILGVHFCPAGIFTELDDNGCPVYSSGAFRFGKALAGQIVWGYQNL